MVARCDVWRPFYQTEIQGDLMSSNESTERSSAVQLLSRADAQLFRMESFFNLTSAMLILFLMLLAVVQVVGRKFFNFPIPGYVDWVEMAMAIFCFLSIAYTQKLGGHVRMEFFIGRFSYFSFNHNVMYLTCSDLTQTSLEPFVCSLFHYLFSCNFCINGEHNCLSASLSPLKYCLALLIPCSL